MVKKISDVMPKDKKSIRQIPLPSGRKRKLQAVEEAPVEQEEEEEIEDPSYEPLEEDFGPPRARSGKLIYAAGLIGIVVVFFGISWLISGATVTITPKSEVREINAIIAASELPANRDIMFERLSIDRTSTIEVPADGERQTERKASGTIIIYNNYSNASQRLIRNTRFETPTGLVYRIDQSVDVPGRHLEDGKTVPGSVEATVYADEPGANYNIGLTDFTIPGFKNDPERYKTFFARSKTPMENGFVGTEKYVTDEKMETASSALKERLKSELLREARNATPSEYLLYDNAVLVEHNPVTTSQSNNNVVISESARLTAFLLKRQDLDAVVAKKSGLAAEDAQHRVAVANTEELTFTFQGIPEPTDDSVSFKLQGAPLIVWKFDEERLKSLLAGIPEEQSEPILKGFVGIEKAEITTRPFWKSSFPKDPRDIKIEVVQP